jgi:hypothetical protein
MLDLPRSQRNPLQGKIKMPSQFKGSFKNCRSLLDGIERLSKRPCAPPERSSFSIPPVFFGRAVYEIWIAFGEFGHS